MNMFLQNFKTAEEAVKYLREEGILTEENKMDCEKIAVHYQEVLNNDNLQREILSNKDLETISSIPAEKRQEKIENIRNKGLIPWRQGLMYLPRYQFLMKEFEEAVEQSA